MSIRGMLVALLMAVSFLASSRSVVAVEPRNLDLVKQGLIRYHDSGEYEKDLARVVQQAQAYLKARLDKNKARHKDQKLAVILDIDETALSNYPDMVRLNFGGTLNEIDEAEGKGKDPAIEPTLKLYEFAKSHGVAVFFITARKENYRSATVSNLENVGYKNYDGLYMLPLDYHEKSVTPFKTGIRKQLADQGYVLVLSLSDQKVDLRGGYAEKAFKLPDPFYLVS